MPRSIRCLAALAAAVFTFAQPPAFAAKQPQSKETEPRPAEAKPADAGSFVDSVNVSVVNVDVFVTDRKGNRISGLTKNDFEIFENGRPIAVSNFSTVQGGKLFKLEEPAAATAAAELAPAPVSEDQRLHMVVYVDNFNIQPFNRNRVMRELRDFLRNELDREDRVMLVTFDRELHMRHPWTSDPAIVASALQDLETLSGNAVARESDRRDALDRIEDSESPQSALGYARLYASNIFNDLSFSIDALRDTINGLAGMPGRKAVLYVSEGLPMIAGEDLFHAVQMKFPDQTSLTDAFEFDASRRFKELTATANANRVTFYTIDAGGLRTLGLGDASRQTTSTSFAGSATMVEQIYVSNLQSPLQQMAEDTGGKAVINANRVADSLSQIAADFDNYYSLGYQPAHVGDGRFYKIEVKVKGKNNYLVRHREGYRDKAPSVMMADGTMAALLHGFATNEMGLKLAFGEPAPNDDGQYLVPIRISIPIGSIVLVPSETAHVARLKLFVAAMDEKGGMSEVAEQAVPISVPPADVERAKTQYYLYSVNLLMRKGPHRVAIGLRDDVGAETSFVTASVSVGN